MSKYIYNMPKRGCYYSDDDSSSDDSGFIKTQSTYCCEKCEKRQKNICSRCEKPKKCDVCKCPKQKRCEHKDYKDGKEPEPSCKDKKGGQCIVITIN